jgi:prepilin-type N-terminal cleavage/methylation domain-containing protein
MVRRAFTLIELLVVIAIIAILAAILFPVFARAKMQAKASSSISNINQIAKAWQLYAQDYDDRAAPVWAQSEGPLRFTRLPNVPYSPWSWLIQAYMKSAQVTQDPVTRANGPEGPDIPMEYLWPYRPQYGYAYTVWSPLRDHSSIDGNPRPLRLTDVASPAQTVLFTSRKDRRTLDWFLQGTIIWMAQVIAPPYCAPNGRTGVNPDGMCTLIYRWGIGGDGGLNPGPSESEGALTGMTAIRKDGFANVVMSDTSTRYMTPARLASGTDWNRNTRSGQVRITDINQYMWDSD